MRYALMSLCAAAGMALPGCGGGEDPPAPRGPAKEVAAALDAFEAATAARDYRRICRDLLTGEARREAGGEECPRRLSSATAGVRRPEITVQRIDVRGNEATVRVVARSAGERPARETIELVRQDGRFRIAALAPPRR